MAELIETCAIRRMDSVGPNEPCICWGPRPHGGRGNFRPVNIFNFICQGTATMRFLACYSNYTTTTLHPFNGLFSRTTWLNWYQKGKTSLDLNAARDDGVFRCSGISSISVLWILRKLLIGCQEK